MKVEINYFKITFFEFLIINLMNWLDGVLTYIGLYIIPKGEFYEINIYALNLFNSIGFASAFIMKICYVLFFSIIFIYFTNKHFLVKIKSSILFNNIAFLFCIILLIFFLRITFSNGLYLIQYYI